MSGEIESKEPEVVSSVVPQKAKSEVEYWDEILDAYENGIGLPARKSPGTSEELDEYLTMDRGHIEALAATDALQIGVRLQQYAVAIHRYLGRETAILGWAKATLKHVLADDVQNYTGYSYEERLVRATKHNEKGKKLHNIQIYAQQRVDRLSFLSNSIKGLADAFFSVYHSKRNQEE